MRYHEIGINSEVIAQFCKRHQIRRLALFGSILREDFHEGSDIDILVEFLPGKTLSLLGIAGMEIELTEMLGRQVDLRTPQDLSRYFREEVLRQAVPQYACET